MVDRKTARLAVILLVVGALIQLLAGVGAGLHQDWMRMSFMLFGSCLSVFFGMSVEVGRRIITSFGRLEELVSERAHSYHIDTTEAASVGVARRANKVVEKIVGIFMVAAVVVNVSLAALAGLHQAPFKLGLHLAACAISVVTCIGVLMVSRLNVYSRQLEELFVERNDSEASNSQVEREKSQ